ncbi:MAG TPA: hypothetical protein VLE72_02835 [Candidatus Saccharimonadales bacterium]|nr:hypothetical protein [Candidatus Saccharimonadales bacterium]
MQPLDKSQKLVAFAWTLSASVVILAFVAWGSGLRWDLTAINAYSLFPLFGLLAFSLMWSHYVASVARQVLKLDHQVLKRYFDLTSLVVLALILLHPGLLSWALWRDGLGLPPGSEFLYVGKALKTAVILGMTGWAILLAYELRRWLKTKPYWWVFVLATDAAMILIFIHSLKLGSNLQTGWFRGVWLFYGASLGLCLIYIYIKKLAFTRENQV